MRRFGLVVALGAALAIYAACGNDYESAESSDGGVDASPSHVEDATAASPPDRGITEAGAATDAADDAADATVDGGSAFDEVTCANRRVYPDDGVFVAADIGGGDAGSDSATCMIDAPCRSITFGLQTAAKLGRHAIYVGRGIYNESLELNANVVIEGGWDIDGQTWTPNCNVDVDGGTDAGSDAGVVGGASLVTIRSATNDATIRVTGDSSVLRFLTLRSKLSTGPSESLYGIVTTGTSTLAVEDVAIVIGAGGQGQYGTNGANVQGTVPVPCPPASGFNGGITNGDAGAPGGEGTFDVNGYEPGGAGTAGTTGSVGVNGQAGSAQTGPQTPECVVTGTMCSTVIYTPTPNPGTNGCGGLGGSPGTGGTGGGSSIGIFASGGTVTLKRALVSVGPGGLGGPGGYGGFGANGTQGAPGATTNYPASNGNCGSFDAGTCASANMTRMLSGGFPGQPGSQGGTGGPGGGGAGGWAVAMVTFGTATITASADTAFAIADAGGGGFPNGPSGVAARKYP